jgi:hypothetical protein
VRFPAAQPTDEIHAGGDVPPLIASTHLQRAAKAVIELEEIVRLEKRW